MNRFHSENIPIFSGKVILGVACVLVATLVIDSSIGKVYYFGINQPSFSSKIIVFGIIVSICIVGQYFTLEYVRSRSREIRVLHLSSLHRAVAITQYALFAMLVLVILQIVFTARYQLLVLTAVVGVSYLLATILMGLLAKRFLLWHRTNKNFIVLLYGLASASIAVNTLSTFSYLTIILSEQPVYVLTYRIC